MTLYSGLFGEHPRHVLAASIGCPMLAVAILFATMTPTEPVSALFGTQTPKNQTDAFTGCESWVGERTCNTKLAAKRADKLQVNPAGGLAHTVTTIRITRMAEEGDQGGHDKVEMVRR